MTQMHDQSGTPVRKQVAELFALYLRRQVTVHEAGLAVPAAPGEVVLYEAAPVQPVDPRLAWEESLSAIRFYQPEADVRGCEVLPEWASLVAGREPMVALPFCVGNFPQLVRSLTPLLRTENLTDLRPTASPAVTAPGLLEWAEETVPKKNPPQMLIALGALRLAGHDEAAARLLDEHRTKVPKDWRAAFANEEAALAWHRGQADAAAALWQAQPDKAPVFFNRGMAALFLNHAAEARSWLNRAVSELPEESGWHHLALLYLALAEMRD